MGHCLLPIRVLQLSIKLRTNTQNRSEHQVLSQPRAADHDELEKRGVSKDSSPRAIVPGHTLDCNTSCKFPFGSHVIALNENVPTNTPAPRGLDCIYLDTNDGPGGGCELLHLASGHKITRRKVTVFACANLVANRCKLLSTQLT